MKIAFDVYGTIEGPKQKEILELFFRLHKSGHEMFVWSNLFYYAVNAIEKHKLPTKPLSKYSITDTDYENKPLDLMDIAIDDDSFQTWLGARQIILINELDSKTEFFNQLTGDAK